MKTDHIVILHGWNLSGEVFSSLTHELKKRGYQVLAPDLPGFGKQWSPPHPWHLVDYANFLKQYFKKNKVKNPIIIGHSFGGRVALKYLQLYPEEAKALVLTGTPGFTPVPKAKLFLFIAIAKIGRAIFSLPPLNILQDWVRRWYYYFVGAREFFLANGVMRDTFKYIVQEDLVTSMESVTVPCFLLWGEYDVIVPVAIARRMSEVIPEAELKVIPEADHGVAFKQAPIFCQYLDRFFAKL